MSSPLPGTGVRMGQMVQVPMLSVTTEDSTGQERGTWTPAHPYLFVVLDRDRPLSGGARHSLLDVEVVTLGRGGERSATRAGEGALRQLAIHLPGRTVSLVHARLIRAGVGWAIEDARSRNGIFLNGVRVTRAALSDGDFIEIGSAILR